MEVEEVVERAIDFLEHKAGYYTHRLESVKLEKGIWIIRFDVAVFGREIIEIRIEDDTGRIISYERIQAE